MLLMNEGQTVFRRRIGDVRMNRIRCRLEDMLCGGQEGPSSVGADMPWPGSSAVAHCFDPVGGCFICICSRTEVLNDSK